MTVAEEIAHLRQLADIASNEVVAVREEVAALQDCLACAGLVSTEQFLAQKHRRRFATVCQKHPLASSTTLADALEIRELVCMAFGTAGFSTVHALRTVSHGVGCIVATALGDVWRSRLCICGGQREGEILSGADCADISIFGAASRGNGSRGTWEALPPMSCKRRCFAAAAVGGFVYVCGGGDGWQALNSAESFDPGTGTWRVLPPMSERRVGAAAAGLHGQLYVCGGGRLDLRSAEAYNPLEEVWTPLPAMLEQRWGVAAASMGHRLFVVGGRNGPHAFSSVDCFDTDLDCWDPLPSMSQRRSGAAAVVVGGTLVVCGGSDGNQDLSSVERYDFQLSRWEDLPPMKHRRWGTTAIHFAGSLYILGGSESGHDLASVERLAVDRLAAAEDGGTPPWEEVAPLPRPRSLAAAAVLQARD